MVRMHDRAGRRCWLAVAGGIAAVTLAGCTSTSATPPAHSAGGTPPMSSASNPAPGTNPASGEPSGTAPVGALQITTLQAGQTITLPATIGYRVTAKAIDAASGYHVRVQADDRVFNLSITGATGTVQLPVDKFLAGRRDLTFTLIGPGNTANASEPVVIHNIMIIGPR